MANNDTTMADATNNTNDATTNASNPSLPATISLPIRNIPGATSGQMHEDTTMEDRAEEVKDAAKGHSHKFTTAQLTTMKKEDRVLVMHWPEDWEAQLAREDWVFVLAATGAGNNLRRVLAVAATYLDAPQELKRILERAWGEEVAGKPKRALIPFHVKSALTSMMRENWNELSNAAFMDA
ncbi:hypothetical protein MBLNU230_g8458t1 [Neophaeotheca triangularis]